MPQEIGHIDAIARRLQRDVLLVVFHPPREKLTEDPEVLLDLYANHDWRECPVRLGLIQWLESQGIAWLPCGGVANTSMMDRYRGQVYVDVPYDLKSPTYQALSQYLELPDGSMRYPEATFCVLPLSTAMENAAHDEPGFWDRWAENF